MTRRSTPIWLSLPRSWEDRTAYKFIGPMVDGIQHELDVVVEDLVSEYDVETFARNRISAVRDMLPDCVTLKEEVVELASGMQAFEWIYRLNFGDSKPRFRLTVYTVVEKRGYTFTTTFTKKTLKTIGVEVREMIGSFEPVSG
jgi:hypothetical protein